MEDDFWGEGLKSQRRMMTIIIVEDTEETEHVKEDLLTFEMGWLFPVSEQV